MNAQEIIERIRTAEKKTPVRVFLKEKTPLDFPHATVFPCGESKIVFGDWKDIAPVLQAHAGDIDQLVVESDSRNSAIPLLDTKDLKARIEPGAIIRDDVEIGDNAVVMMGAVIGAGTMIDMGAVLGGRAIVGKNCHIGAGTVLAGVVEPASAVPVVIEDDVVIGANAVVLEGCRVGKGAVVAAGAVVVSDVAPGAVVAGVPAKVLKTKDGKTADKTALVDALREL